MKNKVKLLLAIQSLLLIVSCTNLLNNSPKKDMSFALSDKSVEYIRSSLTNSRSFSNDSLLTVEASLLKEDQVALHEEKVCSLNDMKNISFSFLTLPYGKYKVEIKVSYNGTPLFTGKSSLIEISEEVSNPSAVITLDKEYAKINYVLNGGDLPSYAPTSYFVGSNVELPPPTRGKDKFLGWYLEDDFSGEKITLIGIDSIPGDVTLYASWEEAVTLTITPENGEIHFPDKIMITSNDPTAVIKYTTDGSDPLTSPQAKTFQSGFEGISISANAMIKAAIEGTNITAEKSFTYLYKIQFSLNGHGEKSPLHIQYLPLDSPVQDPGDPVAAGFEFAGWWDTNKCDNIQIKLGGLTATADKMYHAKWVATP